ncbi:endonuclease/exonuclease/phosphatase family protein [Pseudoteredinibacter isoporae]|uniref:Exonuclease III n=1 Tax=Pseudoteredinibacter isoporae TaxID=570281 RepID=A0A7X0MVT4_9GAMM|nr:endonuclease/exonuclease/phosphatase family protein [Pseudoteredinibacter isoporae]MBB6521460.1 exonuclease III [Pseudoteredinibacter isoporae]NHO87014.1 hypothetical protein [Pseudoteredinibacter isoporae]NIB24533.1 hypothetical protein [Pseudoteredinibacter isoporae]
MRTSYRIFFFLFVFWTSASVSADLSVGDRVTLVKRDQGVPAHPAEGDFNVSFRFTPGSEVKIEAIGHWLKVSGEATDGRGSIGWIAKRYVANSHGQNLPEVTLASELDWCPPKGSSEKHPSGRLRIASWNIENLHAKNGESVYPDSVKRRDVDYERIKCYIRRLDADILAVQEVDGEEALKRIVDTDVYDIVVSKRDADQNTGFAYKKGLNVTPREDFKALNIERERRGTRIDLEHNGKTIRLMSVHLKSGCFSNESSSINYACQVLQKQVPVLEQWIDESARLADGFIILGDFNRRVNAVGDLVWRAWDDREPANADLTSITADMPISCRDNRYTTFIDHIVLDKRAANWFDQASFRHVNFRQADKRKWNKISDHCPIVGELWVE